MANKLRLLSKLEMERDNLPLEAYEDRMDLNRQIRGLKESMMRARDLIGVIVTGKPVDC